MSRLEFMAALRSRLLEMCDAELAVVGRSAEGCPYLTQWLDHYDHQPASRIERTIALWTGERLANPERLQDAVLSRVRGAVRRWVATGEVTGIPESAPDVGSASPGSASSPTAGDPGAPPDAARVGSVTQRTSSDASRSDRVGGQVAEVRGKLGAGAPLDPGVRTRMEPAFGRSFAGVRVHTDERSSSLAADMSMTAFTVGSDIVMRSADYVPGTLTGDVLIAHELAHTVQQGEGSEHNHPGSGDERALEDEADGAAVAAIGLNGPSPALSGGRGLRIQGCSQKTKACPAGRRWYPTATAQWGSLGCTCIWKCLREPPGSTFSGPSISCPPGVSCDDPYHRVDEDYTKLGYGAAFTPLTGEPACGCFALDIEGREQSDAPLVPVTIDMTNVIGPGADMAAGARARARGGPSSPQTDPRTGMRGPDLAPRPPHPLRARAITEGVYTPALAPRLERLFAESDAATMSALARTLDSFSGEVRIARVRQLLTWTESRPSIPTVIEEGATFGRGGTGSVAEVVGRPDLASKTGAGRAGQEAAAMVELELAGIPTVYISEGRTQTGAQRLVLRRIDGVGSKDIIGRPGRPPDNPQQAREYEQMVTERTIADLRRIRQQLVDARLNVGDFQFIVRRSDGAVFINDPTGVTPNSGPSGDIDNIIDRFAAILRRRTAGGRP